MNDLKWIKLNIEMFNNPKIKHLRRLPSGNNIVMIWIMLLTMAGRCNAGGEIYLTENVHYTPAMLSDELDFPQSTVEIALNSLQEMGMIRYDDKNKLTVMNWAKYQNQDRMAEIREYNRLAQQRSRERKR